MYLKFFGHTSGVTFEIVRSAFQHVGQLVHHFGSDLNTSTTISWIAMKFGTDIHDLQRKNHTDWRHHEVVDLSE